MTTPTPRRPHVAFAITALHRVPGGAERVLVDVANGLHRRGYPVSVLTYQHRNGPSFYELDYGIRHLDGRIRDHEGPGRSVSLGPLAGAAQRRRSVAVGTWLLQYGPKVWHLRRLLRLTRPDVAVGFLPSTFTYLELAATGMKVRTVASLHNVPDRDLGADPRRWDQNPVDVALRRRALRTSDANTVLLPSFVDQLEVDVRAKTYVIPNLIHTSSGRADVGDDESDNTILAVGRLSPAKDHATLVDAWAHVEPHAPNWRLRIIGDGPLRARLDAQIDRLGLQRITIDEPTSEIERAYTSAKFLVMPSVHEGFGLVTAEAMACGLPVIGFADCEGTNEIVRDGHNGLLVEPVDDRAAALAAAIRVMITDEGERRRLAQRAPASIDAFQPDPVIDRWERMITDVHRGTIAGGLADGRDGTRR